MRRQLAAWLAVAGLIVSGCTSSAEAGSDLPTAPVTRSMTGEQAKAARLVENFFRSLQARDAHALYALFVQDDQCHPGDIDARLDGVTTSIADGADIEVESIELGAVGATTTVTFELIERLGASEKLIVFEEFFPLTNDGMRWKFDANVCSWLEGPDTEVQDELLLAAAALAEFRLETGTYLATSNGLRYFASGLNVVTDESLLAPGSVLLSSGIDEALLVGQGTGGAWYCLALSGDDLALYGSAPAYEQVAFWETCLEQASSSGW
jgi:hypothetical protein